MQQKAAVGWVWFISRERLGGVPGGVKGLRARRRVHGWGGSPPISAKIRNRVAVSCCGWVQRVMQRSGSIVEGRIAFEGLA
jgi:hypothetical protein